MTDLFKTFPSIIFMAAKPKSGKSNLTKYIISDLFNKKIVKYGIVICPTVFNGGYDFLPEEYLFSKYDEEVLANFCNFQIQQVKDKGKAEPGFIVIDDCVGSINFNSDAFSKLITTYRHFNLTMIITTQYLYKIPPTVRECATYFVSFKQPVLKSVKAIQETYMTEMSVKKVGEYLDENTKDFHFIIVNPDENDEDKYTVAKAPSPEEMKHIKIKY